MPCLTALTGLILCTTTFAQQFTDVSVAAGFHRDFTRSWGNPLWGDFNNDGRLDLLLPNHELEGAVFEGGLPPYIYINNGDGTFTDVIETSGIAMQENDTGAWQGISLGDYDGDGNLDVLITIPPNQGGTFNNVRDLLFKGHGDATWEYVSDSAGIVLARHYGECSFFVDYDNDGHLDIFVKNIPNDDPVEIPTNDLYHNDGDGTFTLIASGGGLGDATNGVTEGSIVSFADYDNDGYMDVAMSGNLTAEELYHNNRDGTFSEVTESAGIVPKLNGQGLAWGDYNNDGLLDLYVSRGKTSGTGPLANALYKNNGDGTFTDVSDNAHVDDNTSTWAAAWGDYDNDGFLDLYVARSGTAEIGVGNANLLYHNNGDGSFTDVAAAEGVAQQDDKVTSAHKLAAWGDYDDDGFLDLATKDGIGPNLTTEDSFKGLHYLFHNNGNSNHYLKLTLKGVESNLNGIGARVTVTYDGEIAFRENNGGGGGEWGSQGAGPLHFGIGTADTATIRITWPSGVVDLLSGVAANSSLTVVEGSSPPPVLAQNIATRLDVQTGDNVGIGGFIVTGADLKKVVIRGLGPSLASSNVPNFLADPVLALHKPNGTVLVNNDWKDTQFDLIRATGLGPTDENESAIYATLEPGGYTAVLSGANGGTGVGLVEVYDLDQVDTSELANVSTRGFVGTGDNVMIGGVIIGPKGAPNATIVVRALGPSLAGVTAPLADPTLALYDANGSVIASNNNWQDDSIQAALVEGANIAPSDPRESAIYKVLTPASYTAIVSGSGGATGVGLVEVYNVK
ncbi:MAG: CRTAC1 family protein [Verrucomicrobiota bacterium]|nr:CRTAC1 family protein [Verrucomicrobiota bacterium]